MKQFHSHTDDVTCHMCGVDGHLVDSICRCREWCALESSVEKLSNDSLQIIQNVERCFQKKVILILKSKILILKF